MLCVTFTDMAVLCGQSSNVCFYKMAGMPMRKNTCHEMALRIVLNKINSIANQYQKIIQPVLSLTVDFYVRLFVKIKHAPALCSKTVNKISLVEI